MSEVCPIFDRLARLLVLNKLIFPSVLTKLCAVVPGMLDLDGTTRSYL